MTRYVFEDVREALRDYWGLTLHRGGDMAGDGQHDGRWDPAYSLTGYVVGGHVPGRGTGHWRYRTLTRIVRAWDLEKPIASRSVRGGS